ncbi:MAG: mechanosensitive ion channel domain-containing protein [Candidatus Krumholzibacteriaceae bacterium]
METTTSTFLKWLLSTGIRIGVIVAVMVFTLGLIRMLVVRYKRRLGVTEKMDPERAKRADTLAKIIENTLRVAILVAAILMILRQVGIEIAPLLAGAGIVGLAVSFGAQSLVKDIINGFFILLENNMNIGDVVEIAEKTGTVEKMNLRVTTLRDLEGKMHVVPNGSISTITNMTKEWSRAVLDVGVAYREDIDDVIEVLRGIGDGLRSDPVFGPLITEPMEILGVESFGDSAVNIRIMFTTKPVKQWQVAREFRRRLKKTFDEKGIRLPFKHHMLYFGDAGGLGRIKGEIDS